MSQSDKSFNVSDRRHFTADGRPREDPAVEEKRSETPPAAPSNPGSEPKVEFSQFILGLAAEASRLIQGEGLPEGMSQAEALSGARSIVAILEMLKDKTEGRRSAEEETLIAELLFQLRMAYVERTRKGQP